MSGIIKGKIKEVYEDGTALILAPINLYELTHREVKECYVDYIDSRPLSGKQRRLCYALINAISQWSGETQEGTKTALKLDFSVSHIESLGEKLFSLSNAPMSLVAEFQRYLVNFILENDVPLNFPLREYADDIRNYVYMCLIHKKCAVCGKRGELHHIDAIGMGNDRTETRHIGREAMSLCREHHKEIHDMGKQDFMSKYHFDGGIEIDKTIAKIYGLRSK
ncbi:MAG: hypothetical protein IIX01_01790 [Clostridia bacterium]|nr:hypothetical protein [Clostridia bacterium]